MTSTRHRSFELRHQTPAPSTLGETDLQHVVLQVADNPEHKLVTFAASEADHQRIAQIAATVA